MRPDIVVVVAPQGQRAAGVGQAVEDLLVQALVAQASVEGLDVAVLLRFAGVDVMPFDLVVVRPFQDGLAGELGPVVRNYAGGFSMDPDESVQLSRNPGPRDAGVGDQAEVFAAAVVIHRQDAELPAGPERV